MTYNSRLQHMASYLSQHPFMMLGQGPTSKLRGSREVASPKHHNCARREYSCVAQMNESYRARACPMQSVVILMTPSSSSIYKVHNELSHLLPWANKSSAGAVHTGKRGRSEVPRTKGYRRGQGVVNGDLRSANNPLAQ